MVYIYIYLGVVILLNIPQANLRVKILQKVLSPEKAVWTNFIVDDVDVVVHSFRGPDPYLPLCLPQTLTHDTYIYPLDSFFPHRHRLCHIHSHIINIRSG